MNRTITVDEMVRQEVYYCVSSLIIRLAELEPDEYFEEFLKYDDSPDAVEEYLHNYADLEEVSKALSEMEVDEISDLAFDEREQLAFDLGFEPELIEIYEYWIISDWLAHKLEQQWGEVVVRDYHGLTIWGRRTTGQMISMDGVMQNIHRKWIDAA